MPDEDVIANAIRDGQQGLTDVQAVIDLIGREQLLLPSGTSTTDGSAAVTPVYFERQGITYVAVFTSGEKAKSVMPPANYVISMPGDKLFAGVAAGAGVVINPGFMEGMEFAPDAVRRIAALFASRDA